MGCGWLGRQLAERLLADGYEVFATTTSPEKLPELEALRAQAFVLELPLARPDLQTAADAPATAELWRADQLVLSLPPGRRDAQAAVHAYGGAVLSALLAYRRARSGGRVLFTSSVGVYGGDVEGRVDEDTPIVDPTPRQTQLLLAEAQVAAQSQRPYQVLRLGGLYGGERDPGRYFAGREAVPNGDAPTNLVHGERAVAVLKALLDAPFWAMHGVINVVDEEHPTRRDRYTAFAKTRGLPLPSFLPGGGRGKVVENTARVREFLAGL